MPKPNPWRPDSGITLFEDRKLWIDYARELEARNIQLEADWGLEAKDSRIAELEAAMAQSVVWMAQDGCDCGASENCSCALCRCNALLNK